MEAFIQGGGALNFAADTCDGDNCRGTKFQIKTFDSILEGLDHVSMVAFSLYLKLMYV